MEYPRCHIVVCPFPFGTHAAPLLQLVEHLASASPDIRFSFINTEKSNAALFRNKVAPNIVPYSIKQENEEVGNPFVDVERFIVSAPTNVRKRMEEVEEEVGVKISCVISDSFLWFCGEFAEERGLPWHAYWCANVVSLSAHYHTTVLRTKVGVLGQEELKRREDELVDCIPGISCIRIRDLPLGIIDGIVSPVTQMIERMELMLPKATTVFLNTFEEISPAVTNDLKSKLRLLCVGLFPIIFPPQVVSDECNCLPWLDKRNERSVVYVGFGRVATPLPHEIVALAEALESSGFPFLWSLDDSNKKHLPSWFIDRITEDEAFGKVVPWAPQLKVLGHPSIGTSVTHCGWNTLLESIVTGVPLIGRPFLGDNTINQRLTECLYKVGVGLEGGVITKSGMIKALHHVLSSNEGKEIRKNMEVLRGLAEESTKRGGSSSENLKALIKLVTSPRPN